MVAGARLGEQLGPGPATVLLVSGLGLTGLPVGVLWWALAPRLDFRITSGGPVPVDAADVRLLDTLVEDRGRFAAGSLPARALRVLDRAALRAAHSVVADTEANAIFLAEYAGIAKLAV